MLLLRIESVILVLKLEYKAIDIIMKSWMLRLNLFYKIIKRG